MGITINGDSARAGEPDVALAAGQVWRSACLRMQIRLASVPSSPALLEVEGIDPAWLSGHRWRMTRAWLRRFYRLENS